MFTSPHEKKRHLLNMIDDMTAAAIDRSSQGYTQFLFCRQQMLNLIDKYMKEDQMRIDFALDIQSKLNEYFKFDCKNNHI